MTTGGTIRTSTARSHTHLSHIRAIAIRRRTPTQQVLARGSTVACDAPPTARERRAAAAIAPTFYGRDGTELWRLLAVRSISLIDPGDTPKSRAASPYNRSGSSHSSLLAIGSSSATSSTACSDLGASSA